MKLNSVVRFLSALTIALSISTTLHASGDVIERAISTVVHIGVLREPSTQIYTVGSGVVIASRRGVTYVLTAKHTLTDADHLFVKTSESKSYQVAYYVADAHKDLAILRVDTGKDTLPVAEVGDSRDLTVGQTVFSLGFPGVSLINSDVPTVSRGIVSALNRVLDETNARREESSNEEVDSLFEWTISYTDNPRKRGKQGISRTLLIQTDAMINSGSSGGSLITEDGKVVGIVRLMVTSTGANVGINFAIPVSEARLLLAIAGVEIEEKK